MWFLTLLLSFLTATVAAQSTVTVTDTTNKLKYVGTKYSGIEQYQDIKYGQDTSGDNRFRHPKAFSYPTGTTIQATAAGAACPQNTVQSLLGIVSENPGVFKISEDCLNLEVVRPAGTKPNGKLPVLVYILGQGNEAGSYNYSLYNPVPLVASSAAKGTPIIYVSMNFRMNVFGWANSPALKKEGSLNTALYDQRLALQWVQSNIATFGGNPNKVTLFGQSDGATSIGLHLVSKEKALFQRGIMQSGGPAADPGVTGNATVTTTSTVAQIAGCGGTTSSEVLACLRKVPMQTLLKAEIEFTNMTTAKGQSQDNFFATIDDTFLMDAPSKLIRTGNFHKNISVITGFTEDDGSIFVPPTLKTTDSVSGYLHSSYPTLSQSTISTLISLYPIQDFLAQAQTIDASPYFLQAAEIYRDINFACQAIDVAHRVTQYGSPSYLYLLNTTAYASVLQLFNASFYGVIHSSDISFVFDQPNLGFGTTAALNTTASRMSGSWSHFAFTGSPSGSAAGTLAGWSQAFTKVQAATKSQNVTGGSIRIIGGPEAGETQLTRNGMLLQRCEFINTPEFYRELQT